MTLQAIGAGLPRTGTASLKTALELLLDARCYHMREIPGHPFDVGAAWRDVLRGQPPDWEALYAGFVAAVDWPTAMYWRELAACYPNAPVILSVREDAEAWWQSADATILPVARNPEAWGAGPRNDLVELLQRFTGREDWDDHHALMDCYDAHVAAVRGGIPSERLVEWRPGDGWEPLCQALGVPVPESAFPWSNRREDWS